MYSALLTHLSAEPRGEFELTWPVETEYNPVGRAVWLPVEPRKQYVSVNVCAGLLSSFFEPLFNYKELPEYRTVFKELDQIKETAANEGCLEPTDAIVSRAGIVLEFMFQETPFAYEVDPEDDGSIVIHALHDSVKIHVFLSPHEYDLCIVVTEGETRRSKYTSRDKICGTFLEGALKDLKRASCGYAL